MIILINIVQKQIIVLLCFLSKCEYAPFPQFSLFSLNVKGTGAELSIKLEVLWKVQKQNKQSVKISCQEQSQILEALIMFFLPRKGKDYESCSLITLVMFLFLKRRNQLLQFFYYSVDPSVTPT